MSVRVVLDLPEDVFSILRMPPGEFVCELRLAAAVKWYELGKISQEKAAGLAGLNRGDFIEALGRFGVSPLQTTEDELSREAAIE